MSKSYDPIRPRGRRSPPAWISGAERCVLKTDDAELFGHVLKDKTTSRVAWTSGGRWYEVTVQNARIKSCQRLT